jgi:hypothetical protein
MPVIAANEATKDEYLNAKLFVESVPNLWPTICPLPTEGLPSAHTTSRQKERSHIIGKENLQAFFLEKNNKILVL